MPTSESCFVLTLDAGIVSSCAPCTLFYSTSSTAARTRLLPPRAASWRPTRSGRASLESVPTRLSRSRPRKGRSVCPASVSPDVVIYEREKPILSIYTKKYSTSAIEISTTMYTDKKYSASRSVIGTPTSPGSPRRIERPTGMDWWRRAVRGYEEIRSARTE